MTAPPPIGPVSCWSEPRKGDQDNVVTVQGTSTLQYCGEVTKLGQHLGTGHKSQGQQRLNSGLI